MLGLVLVLVSLAACEPSGAPSASKPFQSVQSAATPAPVVDDRKAVLQRTIEIAPLAPYWHSKSPVHAAKSETVNDAPVISVSGTPVVWDGDEKAFTFTKVELSTARARVEFSLRREGVTGYAVLSKNDGQWTVDEKSVAEH